MGKKISIAGMTKTAEAAMGWPYVSPGTNNEKGIDCSGLFVRMFRDQGGSIEHGSNSIFHLRCSETGEIGGGAALREGMAVFKIREWTAEENGNRWYGKAPGNLCHIGYVAGVNPLRIIHASSDAGCVTADNKIGKWKWYGRLADVEYGAEDKTAADKTAEDAGKTAQDGGEAHMTGYVKTGNGGGSRIRKSPSMNERTWWSVAEGAVLDITRSGINKNGHEWCYGTGTDEKGRTVTGYIRSDTVNLGTTEDTTGPGDGFPAEDAGGVTLRLTAEEAEEWLRILDFLAEIKFSAAASMREKLEATIGRG